MAVEFRILGPLEVVADGRLITLDAARPRALLVRLLLSPNQVVPVEQLRADLWPSAKPEGAEIALRTLVSRLRKHLRDSGIGDEVILTRANGYLVAAEPGQVDAGRFEAALSEARRLRDHGDWPQAAARYRAGLDLWRGPALGESATEAFALAAAARLEELRVGAVEERIEAELAVGRHAELLGELEALTAEHPLRERLWAHRMLALYRSGRQAEALRSYQSLRHLLADELGIDPGPELARLEEAILQQRPELDWVPAGDGGPAARQAATDGRVTGAPAGRDAELARLWDAWTGSAGQPARLVCIAGEAGIGKTLLLSAMARRVVEDGGSVLSGRCDEESVVPYQPFAEALAAHLSDVSPEDLRARMGWRLADLARAVRLAGEPASPAVGTGDPETDRFRVFDAVTTVLAQAAAEGPVLMTFDDLHWADRPTLLMLRHLLRYGTPSGPLVVGAYIDTDVAPDSALGAFLSDLQREQPVERLVLAGLDEPAVAELVDGVLGPGAIATTGDLVTRLRRETNGNPLFIGELLRHVQETGGLGTLDAGVPASVKELIARRVSRLPGEVGRVLRVAAVAGQEFPLDVVSAVSGLESDALLDALEQTVAARLIVEVPGRGDRYGFSHNVVRRAIYDDLLRSRRAQLHRRIGEFLERRYAGSQELRYLGELAYHFELAGPASAEKAAIYSKAAGDQAFSQLAYEEAEAAYVRSLRILEDWQGADVAFRCDLMIQTGVTRFRSGDPDAARNMLFEAVDLARQAGLPDRLGNAAVALSGPGDFDFQGVGTVDARRLSLLEEALAAIDEEDRSLRAKLLVLMAVELYWSPDSARRSGLAREAVALAEESGDPATVLAVLCGHHVAVWGPEHVQERLTTATELIALAERAGDVERMLQALHWRVTDLLAVGDLPSADAAIEQFDRVVSEINDPRWLMHVEMLRALRAFMEGQWEDGERHAATALELGKQFRADVADNIFTAQLFPALLEQGKLRDLGPMLLAIEAELGDMAAVRCALTFFMLEEGNLDEARRRLDALAEKEFTDIPRDALWALSITFLARVASELGDGARASILYRLMAGYEGRMIVTEPLAVLCFGPAAHYLGILAATMGLTERALAHFDQALVVTTPVFRGHTYLARAKVLAGRGDLEGARTDAAAAVEIAQKLGMKYLEGKVDTFLGAMDGA